MDERVFVVPLGTLHGITQGNTMKQHDNKIKASCRTSKRGCLLKHKQDETVCDGVISKGAALVEHFPTPQNVLEIYSMLYIRRALIRKGRLSEWGFILDGILHIISCKHCFIHMSPTSTHQVRNMQRKNALHKVRADFLTCSPPLCTDSCINT